MLHVLLDALGNRLLRLARKVDPTGRGQAEDRAAERVVEWNADPDHVSRLVDFPLQPDAVVFDVGGFRGDWALEILCRYGARIDVFEPVPEFYDHIQRRFAFTEQVAVHPFGLGGASRTVEMSVAGDSSSAFHHLGPAATTEVGIRDIVDYLVERDLESVDLVKLNIEGAEYELLERVLDAGRAAAFRFLLVQFHDQLPGASDRAASISQRLESTHELLWRFPFVWEAWALRDAER